VDSRSIVRLSTLSVRSKREDELKRKNDGYWSPSTSAPKQFGEFLA
jgi:hypothetical protein